MPEVLTDSSIYLGVAIATGGDKKSSAASNEASWLPASCAASTAGASADAAGIGSAKTSALICGSNAEAAVGISSGGCSTAADARTSNNGALTAKNPQNQIHQLHSSNWAFLNSTWAQRKKASNANNKLQSNNL